MGIARACFTRIESERTVLINAPCSPTLLRGLKRSGGCRHEGWVQCSCRFNGMGRINELLLLHLSLFWCRTPWVKTTISTEIGFRLSLPRQEWGAPLSTLSCAHRRRFVTDSERLRFPTGRLPERLRFQPEGFATPFTRLPSWAF